MYIEELNLLIGFIVGMFVGCEIGIYQYKKMKGKF